MTNDAEVAPSATRLVGSFECALTVDVEEWYHTCWVREYVEPARRPALAEELDRLLPELLALFAELGVRATFFVLGEVARRLPRRIREAAAAGHEIASHGDLHLRAEWMRSRAWRRDVAAAKARLEDLVGEAVVGFRAPEWSLRETGNPKLEILADLGYTYDSSLAPALGSGRRDNPLFVTRLDWPSGRSLVEFPPLTWGGRLQLPAGGWTARLLPAVWIARAVDAHRQRGGLPVLVVHPWELSGRPTPGMLTGLARFMHEAGRDGYLPRFRDLARIQAMLPLREAAGPVGALLRPGHAALPPTLEMPRSS